jgi:hypothetical protein
MKKTIAFACALFLIPNLCFASWDKALPTDSGKLKDAPGQLRANWQAVETGTDAALQITDAKVAASAAIADTKLATISTAGKVNGAALTGLASVPSGAGVIPVANTPYGTSAYNLVRLDASAKIPAVDGSQITSLTATQIPNISTDKLTSGTLPVGRGGTGATAAANGASGVVVLNGSTQLPAVSGALLTNITGANIVTPLGAWNPYSTGTTPWANNTVFQAATDGFVIVDHVSNSGNLSFYTDASNPPTTKRGYWDSGTASGGVSGTITCPVKKGEYWKVVDASAGTFVAYFIPIGS